MSSFKKATRKQARARIAFDGVSGSGKTYTSLRLAFALANANGGNGRVAVVDTERGSASLYAGLAPDGIPFDFDVLELQDFAPTKFERAIQEAGKEGYAVIVVDSLSHAWEGKGGALDQVDAKSGNKFSAWKDVTPQHRGMIDAILQSPCHVICTMRSKTEYVLEPDDRGRMVPRKVGMAPVQRAGMEYEFTFYASIDSNHMLSVTKSRCPAIADCKTPKADAAFFQPFIEWLYEGDAATEQTQPVASPCPVESAIATKLKEVARIKTALGIDAAGWGKIMAKRGVKSAKELSAEQLDDLIGKLAAKLAGATGQETKHATTVKIGKPAEPASDTTTELESHVDAMLTGGANTESETVPSGVAFPETTKVGDTNLLADGSAY